VPIGLGALGMVVGITVAAMAQRRLRAASGRRGQGLTTASTLRASTQRPSLRSATNDKVGTLLCADTPFALAARDEALAPDSAEYAVIRGPGDDNTETLRAEANPVSTLPSVRGGSLGPAQAAETTELGGNMYEEVDGYEEVDLPATYTQLTPGACAYGDAERDGGYVYS